MWDDDPYPYRAFDDEWITVWVVAVNVNAGLTEEGEENPGLYINVNWSDDDGDGWEPNENPPGATYRGDKDDDEIAEGGDDDFRVFSVHVDPEQAPVTVVVQFQNNIKVWRTFTKKMEGGGTSEVVSGTGYDPQNIPWPLLVEGQSGTQNFRGVSLTATVKYGQNQICSDTVKITVFEVTLAGLFAEAQQPDCDKKHHTFKGSSDRNGKISWDDANGDGTVGDNDPNCEYFRNCMECQGTVKPAGLTDEVELLFETWIWAKAWEKSEGGGWELAMNHTPWHEDVAVNFVEQDRTPSAEDHIYDTDRPGHTFRDRVRCDYVADIGDLKVCAVLSFGGDNFYQCSDWYKWHYQIYVKPKGGTEWLTRDVPAKQKLGGGWINVPDNP